MNDEWRERAACRLPGAPDMHPVDGPGVELAIAWCLGCPVQADCYEAGLREPYGVWGGLSERARAQIRRRLRLTAIVYSPAPQEEPCPTN